MSDLLKPGFDDLEAHNEDIILPVANPTQQEYVDKLVIRAGKMDKDPNSNKTALLDLQTRQATGEGYNVPFASTMAIAAASQVKDAFSRLKLG